MEFTPCKVERPLQCMELEEKQEDKAIWITSHTKAFGWQRIPEPSCMKEETAKTDILTISRNVDKKVM